MRNTVPLALIGLLIASLGVGIGAHAAYKSIAANCHSDAVFTIHGAKYECREIE